PARPGRGAGRELAGPGSGMSLCSARPNPAVHRPAAVSSGCASDRPGPAAAGHVGVWRLPRNIMADAHNQLRPLCEDPPVDLVEYFDTFPIGDYSDPVVGLLPLPDALAWSADFRTFHPLAEALGLVVLDDANTSNHHCYITRGPLAGSILYLVHD